MIDNIVFKGCAVCDVCEEYCAMLVRRGRRESTAKAARNAIRRCCETLAQMGVHDLGMIGPEDVAMMAQRLQGKESTRRQLVSGFGCFYRWATGQDVVAQARLLWNPPAGEGRTWITAQQYALMMAVSEPRERLIFALAATMGLRRGEIAALSLQDVQSGVVHIKGKGHGPDGKAVDKPMSAAVARELQAYLRVRQGSSNALLLSVNGRPLDTNALHWLVRRAAKRAGVECTMHTLRRLYATTLADAGVPLETIARMMRHESPVTTMRCYLQADPRRMAAAQAQVDAVLNQTD